MIEHYLDRLARTINENWNAPALTDFYLTEDGKSQDTSRGNHYTYGEMYMEICRVADLLTNLGLQSGDHIAICGANSAHWVIAYLAIAKMQGVSVTVMHTLQPDEQARLVEFSDAKALFVDPDLWEELKEQSLPQIQSVISFESWQILRGEKVEIPNRKSLINNRECGFLCSEPDDLAMICFTSGSSGGARGVMLSYRNINNNAKNITDGYPDDDITHFLSVLPMAHVYGLMTEIIAQLLMGEHICILVSYLTIDTLYRSIQINRPYALRLIPILLSKLIETYHDSLNLLHSTCKQIYIGGALFDTVLEQNLLAENVPISIGYGQTETGPLISYSICATYKAGTCGKIVEGMTCHIAPNGEILVKGENVMLGYYKDPEATAQKIDKDGWLHTGDKGHMDEDGYLYVEGRLEQDIIVLPNGENIRPDNIEALINALPEVKESIVIARDGRLIAIVVPQITNHQSPITNADLRRHVLRTINPQLPLFSQLYDVEITDQPLQRTEKQTIKRYLYK